MKLSQLIKSALDSDITADVEITGIKQRSDLVVPGDIFVAITGFSADGHAFIEDALKQGAVAVVAEKELPIADIPVVKVPCSRSALSKLASTFYGNPAEKLNITGITGTNGKTTTAYLLAHIMNTADLVTGMMGTVAYTWKNKTVDAPLTTPDALTIHQIMGDMVSDGVTHLVMEISSHAIDLGRVADCDFNVAVFTNLSQDHLDYHKTMDAYWGCKSSFLEKTLLSDHGIAVVNSDDSHGAMFARIHEETTAARILTTGRKSASSVRAVDIQMDMSGIRGSIEFPGGKMAFSSGLVGDHNLENILNAVGAALALKVPVKSIEAALSSFNAVPGRLERIPGGSDTYVFVDYAHTPDALDKAITTLNKKKTGKLITVFGCGGDRDAGKRPQMGEIAANGSDIAIATSDNPRTENPETIILDIEAGIQKTSSQKIESDDNRLPGSRAYLLESDREQAIKCAISMAKPGDTVLIAGKGHETYQIIGTEKIPFDDRQKAREALASNDK